MENLRNDLSAWWDLNIDIILPIIIPMAILMSAITLIAYIAYFIIFIGITAKNIAYSLGHS
jgi:hypothetical protein